MVTYFPKPLNKQVAAISDSLKRTQKGLGIGASGDTHAAIGSGQFVYVKDHSSLAEGLYKSKAAIAQNGTLSTSNLTADGSGGLNDLQSQITSLNSKITTVESGSSGNLSFYKIGKIVFLKVAHAATTDVNKWVTLGILPEGFRPDSQTDFLCYDNSVSTSTAQYTAMSCRIYQGGTVSVWPYKANANAFGSVVFFVP